MSHFTLRHKGKNYSCNTKEFSINPLKSITQRNKVSCQDEQDTKIHNKTTPSKCGSVTYTSNNCKEMPRNYHQLSMVYYNALFQITSIFQTSSTYHLTDGRHEEVDNIKRAEYSDDNLLSLLEDLEKVEFDNPDAHNKILADYTRSTVDPRKFWHNLFFTKDSLALEVTMREKYQNDCVCIGNESHITRLNLAQNLLIHVNKVFAFFFQVEYKKGKAHVNQTMSCNEFNPKTSNQGSIIKHSFFRCCSALFTSIYIIFLKLITAQYYHTKLHIMCTFYFFEIPKQLIIQSDFSNLFVDILIQII
jgi:hypothetical protein